MGSSGSFTILVQNVTPDVTPPTVQFTSPTDGATVSGVTTVQVNATDNIGVTKVEWYVNGALAGSGSATTSFSWDTTGSPNGGYTIEARAYDAAGNVGTSGSIAVTVNNPVQAPPDTVAPTVQVTSPPNGAVIAKSTTVAASASDNVAVTRLDILVDGKLYKTCSTCSTSFQWNAGKLTKGSHTLQGVAYDAAGNCTRSAVVTVYK
jgi:hypothetical protein